MREVVSHYKVLEQLGRGGMGVVYKAEDTKLKRFVALKFLPAELTHDEQSEARFMHEAQAASALDHPNICTIHEINETSDGLMFIVMPLYEGETLRQKLTRGRLPVAEAIDYAIQISQGLAKAHEAAIVHRDLKPANVIITQDGITKILDFGLAKLVGQARLTKTGSTLGTMAYMSPEQTRGEEVDHRADIWALGVVLYEMLTGQLPFKGEYEHAIMFGILKNEPQPIREIIQDISPFLETTITKALEKSPSLRHQNTDEILASLIEARQELETSQQPPYRWPRWPSLLLWIKNRWRLIQNARVILFLMVFLIAIAVVVILQIPRVGELTQIQQSKRHGKISIAIPYFENNTNDPELVWLSRGIADMLITDLGQSQYLRVISPERLVEHSTTYGSRDQTAGRGSALQITRNTGANVLVTGSVIKAGSELRILAQLYDLNADSLISAAKVTSKDHKTIIAMVDHLSMQLKLALEITASDSPGIAEGITQAKTNSVEAYKHYVLGTENLEKSQYTDAIANLRKAVECDSTFAYAYAMLTNAYDVLGEASLAERFIRKGLHFSKKLPFIDQLKIQLQYAQLRNEWDTVLDNLKQLAMLQPDESEWHFHLGWHYATHLRAYEQSVREYKRAIEIDSVSQPRLYYYLGYAYLGFGKRDEAVNTLKIYVSLLPDAAQSHDALGAAYLLTGDYDKALQEFQQALMLKPNFLTTFSHLGDLNCARGKRADALEYYQHYLDTAIGQNKEKRGYLHLARFYLENNELPKAAQRIKQVLVSDSLMIEGHWIQGLIALKEGLIDSANAIANRMEWILDKSRSDYTREFFHHLKGKIALARGRPGPAIGEFDWAIRQGPLEQAYFRCALADAYFQMDDWQSCIRTCTETLEYNSQYAPAYVLLGNAHEKTNAKAQAVQAYEKFLELWKNADENLSLVKEVKDRLNSLKS